MENKHARAYSAPPESIRPWLEKAWSASDDDIFPRDYLSTWRKPLQLIPGQTRMGHGPFSFKLREWDGSHWCVDYHGPGFRGWHGFVLKSEGSTTVLTHELEMRGNPLVLALARLFIWPLHDWAVESILDRLQGALETGRVPSFTERPLRGWARFVWQIANLGQAHNRHSRHLPYPIEKVRPWIERLWSATDKDAFPRDVIPTFRRNPPELDPQALVPGVTRIGHGPTRFLFEKWDGRNWAVKVLSNRMVGSHGFVLTPEGEGTRVTHILTVRLSGLALLEWPLLIRPIHDWAVEALFDRLEIALESGRVPQQTARPVPPLARWVFRSWGMLRRLGLTKKW